ncbi:MAG: hypothetical protein NZM11_03335 [Anaerolineales bacterium]|nr:hypothetical protein [Anaerolineales bacterium]
MDAAFVDEFQLELGDHKRIAIKIVDDGGIESPKVMRPGCPRHLCGGEGLVAQGSREVLLAQLVRIVAQFVRSDRIAISPPLFYQDELRRRLIITLNMSCVVQHVWEAVRQENTERLTPVFDRDHSIRSTGDMRTWYRGKPCERTRKSHINSQHRKCGSIAQWAHDKGKDAVASQRLFNCLWPSPKFYGMFIVPWWSAKTGSAINTSTAGAGASGSPLPLLPAIAFPEAQQAQTGNRP